MGGMLYDPAYDQVGSLRVVADGSGNPVKRIDYDSFGNIITETNPTMKIPFGFAGGLHDRDTGLVRFGYRDYDPDTGRWTAKDPIGFAGGDSDLYGYCVGDPVNLTDPAGLFNFWGGVVGGAVGGLFGALQSIGSANQMDVVMAGIAGGFVAGMLDPTPGFAAAYAGFNAGVGAIAAGASGCKLGGMIGAAIGSGIGGYYGATIPGLQGTAIGGVLSGGLGWAGSVLGDGLHRMFFN